MSAALASTLLLASPALVDAGIKIVRAIRHRDDDEEESPSSPTKKRERSVQTSPSSSFTPAQVEAMRAIALEVKQAPLPPHLARSRPALILGLWVNAWHESRLRPDAYNGKGEDSVGLFQINRKAHPGHSKEDLQDPRYNTRVMLSLIAQQQKRYEPLLAQGASIYTLTAAITLWTERPRDKEQKAVARAQTLNAWFPHIAHERALDWSVP